jgi:flagellar FliL protein
MPAAKSSKKKLLVLVLVAVIAAAAASGVAWFLTRSSEHSTEHKEVKAMPAIFVPIEPFTVNLQAETGEQFLQATIQLQVSDLLTVEVFKANLPLVRNRILILLSSKKASEIASAEGKQKLADEIVALMKQPFIPKGKPQEVDGALFTAFIIQ